MARLCGLLFCYTSPKAAPDLKEYRNWQHGNGLEYQAFATNISQAISMAQEAAQGDGSNVERRQCATIVLRYVAAVKCIPLECMTHMYGSLVLVDILTDFFLPRVTQAQVKEDHRTSDDGAAMYQAWQVVEAFHNKWLAALTNGPLSSQAAALA
jgi:hypothetical protein